MSKYYLLGSLDTNRTKQDPTIGVSSLYYNILESHPSRDRLQPDGNPYFQHSACHLSTPSDSTVHVANQNFKLFHLWLLQSGHSSKAEHIKYEQQFRGRRMYPMRPPFLVEAFRRFCRSLQRFGIFLKK